MSKLFLFRLVLSIFFSTIAFYSLIPGYLPLYDGFVQRSLQPDIKSEANIPVANDFPISITPTITAAPTGKVLSATVTQSNTLPKFDVSGLYVLENNYRVVNGLPPLTIDSRLENSAAAKAFDMVTNNYFAHVSPSGISWTSFVLNAGYYYAMTGENLAIGFNSSQAIFTGWENSPEHKANLLNAGYQNIGIAVLCNVSITSFSHTCVTVMHLGKSR